MPIKLLELETQRRDAILNAALKEFAIKGYNEASTNVIAKEAGISKGLMFHYVKSKKDLFFVVYDYFTEMMNREYFELMNYDEKDIFERLRQSYLLQLELIKKYPCIFEVNKLSADSNPDEIKKELAKKYKNKQISCFERMFDLIDESKFKDSLDIGKCKHFILWSNIGFTNQILEEARNFQYDKLDYDSIVEKLDENLQELRKIFYK
ncbi:MAG: TetR/AcrR family transcriptional regulator [Firmicutes bacterium]|nr:TetR/AcrR family transcriptional regulator [Bacillota bacterium]